MKYDIFDRGFASVVRATAVAAALCFAAAAPVMAADQPPTNTPAMTPAPAATPTPTKGEFDNSCTFGLTKGQVVKTDCSINWTAPDGKVYCFSREASKETFLKNPSENIQKAKEFFLAKDLAKDNAAAAAPAAAAPAAASAAQGAGPTKAFTEDDVNAAVKQVVDARSKDGTFVFRDPKLNADLNLIFEQIKIVRGMAGYGWFANVIFHDKDEAKKQYAIDFWFKPEGQELKLMDIRVQKGPKQDGDSWIMITRLPVAWWWLPIQEHPGDMEVTRAWQVMGAIHSYIATHKDQNGALPIKDDKTGETVPLEFVEIHQPVRHLKKEGEYFVCTDFRKPGSQDEYYDIDFWVNQKTGKLEVDNVKVHKVPVQEDGIWTQVPRYTFDGMDFDVTN
jgi:YHS domain-containing protein